jgi:hypothetical protein
MMFRVIRGLVGEDDDTQDVLDVVIAAQVDEAESYT